MKHFIKPGLLPSTIHIPSSKSYANRALILAALKSSSVKLTNLSKATDVTFLIEGLKQVGLDIECSHHSIEIKNHFPACEKNDHVVEVGEGGTTARFLACLLATGSKKYTLILGTRLKERPWNEFIDLIHSLGGSAELQEEKLIIQGPIEIPSELEVDCSKTTQFASGFQLVAAFTKNKIIPLNMTSSESYWQMSHWMIQELAHKNEFSIPLDWSSASYPLAFAALKQEIHFPGLHFDPYQADAFFYKMLNDVGAVTELERGITVHPVQVKKTFLLDVSLCLDLVPTLAFFLSHIEGEHVLSGVDNLIHKESNRLEEVMRLLREVNVQVCYENKKIFILGKSNLQVDLKDFVMPDDHRMVMAASLFLRSHSGGTISPADAVRKSYPSFFSLMDLA